LFDNNWLALAASFALALLWLRICNFAAQRGWVSSGLSRKIIHIGTGPIYVLSWLFFNDAPEARYLAALIPGAITAQFALVGFGLWRDPAAVTAMSRSGDRREILRGPLYYGIAHVLLTIVFWKESPVGMVALMLLCGGDGLADVVGKRMRSASLPWSPEKSIAGSLAVFVGGVLASLVVLGVYSAAGQLTSSLGRYFLPVTGISLAGMMVESLPFKDLDNLTVPAVAVLLGLFLF
jgi:phytol kinase